MANAALDAQVAAFTPAASVAMGAHVSCEGFGNRVSRSAMNGSAIALGDRTFARCTSAPIA